MTAQPPKSDWTAPSFLFNVLSAIVILVMWFSSRSGATDRAIELGQQNQLKLESSNEKIEQLQLQIAGLSAQVSQLMAKYNQDMDKYIREPHR